MQQQNAKSMKYHKMQQSKFSLPVTATDATSGMHKQSMYHKIRITSKQNQHEINLILYG